MRPQRQRHVHQPERGVYSDCHRAALATVFDVPIDEVPHFGIDAPSAAEFNARVEAWLALRNVTAVNLPISGSRAEVMRSMLVAAPSAYWLLGGCNRAGILHTVVCYGGLVVHDPSRDLPGIARPCRDGHFWATFLVPREPALCRPLLARAPRFAVIRRWFATLWNDLFEAATEMS